MSERYTFGLEPSLLLRIEKTPCSPDAKWVCETSTPPIPRRWRRPPSGTGSPTINAGPSDDGAHGQSLLREWTIGAERADAVYDKNRRSEAVNRHFRPALLNLQGTWLSGILDGR